MKKLFVLSIVFMFLFASLGYGLVPAPGDNPTVKKVVKKESKKKDPTDPIVYVKEKGKKYHKKMFFNFPKINQISNFWNITISSKQIANKSVPNIIFAIPCMK